LKAQENIIEEILPDLYRLEILLPGNPLGSINSYLIKGNDRFLMIDTGFNTQKCRDILEAGLHSLNVDLKRTDFFITHCHCDHIGLVSTLATQNSRIYLSRAESEIARAFGQNRWDMLEAAYAFNGLPEEEFRKSIGGSPAFLYGLGPGWSKPYEMLSDGDRLEIGDYRFVCIETPGHSPGHCCLYEPLKKILLSGDHILFDITPNIAYCLELEDPLKHYLQSLDKIYGLDVELVLPGHRHRKKDHKARIDELRAHHKTRLEEVLAALNGVERTAYEVTPHIHWEIEFESWDSFPAFHRHFAVGETIAHLEYLAGKNIINKRMTGGKIRYCLS
jgi:glyoxylase-like metal-dependent hydrolase (beta-lactamase superfamily II)